MWQELIESDRACSARSISPSVAGKRSLEAINRDFAYQRPTAILSGQNKLCLSNCPQTFGGYWAKQMVWIPITESFSGLQAKSRRRISPFVTTQLSQISTCHLIVCSFLVRKV